MNGGDEKHKVLVGKHEGKSPLERTGRRWKGDLRIDLREMGWEILDWVHLA
jgi:hypothetical protein